MLVCLYQWLKEQAIEVTVIAEQASKVAEQHHLPAVQNYPFLGQYGWVESLLGGKALRTLAALRSSDMILCGGGDIVRDSNGWRTFTFQVEKLVVGLILRKPVYLLNVGLSKPVTRYGRATLKWLLPRCSGIIVRDERSVEICRQNSAVKCVRLLPDIVRRLADLFPSAAPAQLPSKSTILVALHGDSNVYGEYDMTERRIETLAGMLDSLVEQHGVDIEFFPFQPEGHGGDAAIAHKVQSRMRHPAESRILSWTINLPELADRFARSRLVIAMRLHAAVLAATYAIPCVLMPYDQKVVEFGEQAQIPYVLNQETLDDPVRACEILNQAMLDQIAPLSLEPSGDWMKTTLRSLFENERQQ